jgi:hypothetical protein
VHTCIRPDRVLRHKYHNETQPRAREPCTCMVAACYLWCSRSTQPLLPHALSVQTRHAPLQHLEGQINKLVHGRLQALSTHVTSCVGIMHIQHNQHMSNIVLQRWSRPSCNEPTALSTSLSTKAGPWSPAGHAMRGCSRCGMCSAWQGPAHATNATSTCQVHGQWIMHGAHRHMYKATELLLAQLSA